MILPLTPEAFASLADVIDGWLADFLSTNEQVLAVDHGGPGECGAGERRWYVRMAGDEKDFTTVWLTLGQRTLRYETYVLPSPPQASSVIYETVLRRNNSLIGCHYAIGDEDAIYLRGELAAALLDHAELDRVIGTLFVEVERTFGSLVHLAFARRPD